LSSCKTGSWDYEDLEDIGSHRHGVMQGQSSAPCCKSEVLRILFQMADMSRTVSSLASEILKLSIEFKAPISTVSKALEGAVGDTEARDLHTTKAQRIACMKREDEICLSEEDMPSDCADEVSSQQSIPRIPQKLQNAQAGIDAMLDEFLGLSRSLGRLASSWEQLMIEEKKAKCCASMRDPSNDKWDPVSTSPEVCACAYL
jgi:hypothetical protein